MEIKIEDDLCMMCGDYMSPSNYTIHHAIPQRYKPINNALCPVCKKCHSLIHSEDIEGLKGHYYRITKNLKHFLEEKMLFFKKKEGGNRNARLWRSDKN